LAKRKSDKEIEEKRTKLKTWTLRKQESDIKGRNHAHIQRHRSWRTSHVEQKHRT